MNKGVCNVWSMTIVLHGITKFTEFSESIHKNSHKHHVFVFEKCIEIGFDPCGGGQREVRTGYTHVDRSFGDRSDRILRTSNHTSTNFVQFYASKTSTVELVLHFPSMHITSTPRIQQLHTAY